MKSCPLKTILDPKVSFGKVMQTMRSYLGHSGMISYTVTMVKMSYTGSREMIELQEVERTKIEYLVMRVMTFFGQVL